MRALGLRPARVRRVLAWIGVASVLVAGPAAAQTAAPQTVGEWSQLGGGPGHTYSAEAPEPPYRLAWHVGVDPGGATGRQGLSQPIVAGGTVVATAPDRVMGVDAATGEVAWTVDRDGGPSTPPAVAGGPSGVLLFTEGWAGHPPAPASASPSGTPSPSVSSPTGAAGSGSETVDSRLVAIDLGTMDPAWDPVPLGDVSRSGVAVQGTTAFVGDRTGTLTAVDVQSGEVRWEAEVGGPVDMTPAVVDGLVFVAMRASRAGASAVVALNVSNGEQRWQAEPAAQGPSAISGEGGTIYVLGFDVPVQSLVAGSGAPGWTWASTGGGAFDAGVAVTPERVVAADRRGLVTAFSLGGDRVWDFAINEPIARGAPVVVGDAVLVATEDGALQAFDLATGERRWRGLEGSGPARGIAAGGGVVVVLRAGASAGLDAWATDPGAVLERVASPTSFDAVPALLSFAGAAALLVAISFALSRTIGGRSAPLLEEGDEPVDPLESGEDES